MKKPNWKNRFRNLPEIPKYKKWIDGESVTLEQKISFKLIKGNKISPEEKVIMEELSSFYENLFKELDKLDYSDFSSKDFLNFKNYIFYAFNFIIYLTNDVTIFQLYRIVINEKVTGSKQTIKKTGFLTYPPLHIVKKNNSYNRANTPETTVFYCSETIDTALNELKPKVGDIVTVGFWRPTRNGKFISYPISHNDEALGINESSSKAMAAFTDFKKNQDETLTKFIEVYLKLLGKEYSKPISHHYEYLISSMFSERILNNPRNKNTPYDIEMIIYPSVGNKYNSVNFAIRREIIRHNFKLSKVIEFEVTETDFDNIQVGRPDEIRNVKYSNFKETSEFEDNNIIW